jgi:hypothetical protein
MRKVVSILGFWMFLSFSLFGQVDVGTYISLLYPLEKSLIGREGTCEIVGIAAEILVGDKMGLELGGTFNKKTIQLSSYIQDPDYNLDGLYYYSQHGTNTLLNLKVIRYIDTIKCHSGFFFGAFLRYWLKSSKTIHTDEFSSDYLNYLQHNPIEKSRHDHKISLGLIAGYKGRLFRTITWKISAGAGFSPTFLYFRNVKYYSDITSSTEKVSKGLVLYHLSFLGQLGIGYRF